MGKGPCEKNREEAMKLGGLSDPQVKRRGKAGLVGSNLECHAI